jgi:hypothetical protein
MSRNIMPNIISFLFITLFVYAALSKLLDYWTFRAQLGQSPLLTAFAGIAAWIVPSIELLISVLLLTRRWRLIGLYGSFCLMIIFSEYIISIQTFSDYIPCACGGILQKMSWSQHLTFNLCFVVISLAAILSSKPESGRSVTSEYHSKLKNHQS